MKQFKSILVIAITVMGFLACQKDEGASGIKGTWEGFWGFDFETPDVYEKWEMKKNGDLSAYKSNGDLLATGTWHVDGFNFEAEYTTVTSHHTYLFEGLYSDAAGELTGNWGTEAKFNEWWYVYYEQTISQRERD